MRGVSAPRSVPAMARWCHGAPGPTGSCRATVRGRGTSGALRSLYPQRTGPRLRHRPTHRRIDMRSINRAGGALIAGLLLVAVTAAPALACGGLIGPNGAVNLLRTTTFAGYHDGVEHYITSFEFAGGGGAFGSLTPLPGVPTSVEKGGDWTLQRLRLETDPVQERLPRRSLLGRPPRRRFGRGPHGSHDRRARHHGPARRRRRGRRLGQGPRLPPPAGCARSPRVLRGPKPDLPGRRVRWRSGCGAWPERRRRHAGPHHDPDREPLGAAAHPGPRQGRHAKSSRPTSTSSTT